MHRLEVKIPPPMVVVLVGAAMWGLALISPSLAMSEFVRLGTSGAIALVGGSVILAGILSFRSARTTLNPLSPRQATALITSGIYRITRNPMYVGLAFVLVAWAVYLAAILALIGPLVFVLYMNRFQIAPEERALTDGFGSAFTAYQSTVRRWL